MKGAVLTAALYVVIAAFLFIGWVKCIYKAVNCNWEPIGAAEIVYTGGVFLGYGGIIGWLDIEDK